MVAKDSAARKRASEHVERRPAAGGAQLRPVDGVAADSESTSDEGALGLDRLIHERMRLGIVSALAANDSLTFNDLKLLLGTTDGNLSVHARKLEDAKYITCTKSFEGRVPRTEYKLTAEGRRALKRYVDHMEALIRAIRER
jgi:DNA-binding transcriptional ArsR family regulator